jgi:hypothetical protein
VARFSAIEIWSFEMRTSVVLLCWGACSVIIRVISWLCSGSIGVCVVALVLALIVGRSSTG